jgi:phage gp29-like protein
MLYDHLGRPVDTGALRREHAAPSLVGVRSVWHEASVAQGLTPERLARILRDAAEGELREYLVLAEEMEEREPHYASVLGTRKRAVAGLPVTVEAASDEARDVEIADAVREELVGPPQFGDLVDDLLDALGKGFSACEIMWETRPGRWVPREYRWTDQRFFLFDRGRGRELRLLDQADMYQGLPLPAYKFVTHLPRLKSGLPARGGLARLAAAAYMCKAFTLSDWMRFAEVFGMPIRVGRYGPQASEQDKLTLIRAVANIGTDAACIIPDGMRLEFVESGKSTGGQDLFARLADWLDRQISKAVLGQTMTTDDGASLSQAQVHDEVRQDIRDADARQLGNTINRDLVRPFVDLNYGPPKGGYPRVSFFLPEAQDLKLLAEALGILVPLGLRVEQSVVRDRFNLPDPEPGAELLGVQPLPQEPPALNRALNRQSAPQEPDPVEALADEALEDWERVLAPMVDPVLALAERAESLEGFLAGLTELAAGGLDSTALVRSLAEATFRARGVGDAAS